MTDVVHDILKKVNQCMIDITVQLPRFPVWKDKHWQFVTLAAYRNRTYNHLVQDHMLLFHDLFGSMTTGQAAAEIIDYFGWSENAWGLITFHWLMYEGWQKHISMFGKEPINLEAYFGAAYNEDLAHMNTVLEKEY